MRLRPLPLALLAGLLLAAPIQAADLQVEHAWVRATAPGQKVAGGFMDLTAASDLTLVGGSSPVSATLELHSMKMANGMMEMRQIREIPLPKGQTVSLKPGGLHVMFIGLKAPLRAGDTVPVELIVRDPGGKEEKLSLQAPVQTGAGAHAGMGHAH